MGEIINAYKVSATKLYQKNCWEDRLRYKDNIKIVAV
jgi:hypothetical protein